MASGRPRRRTEEPILDPDGPVLLLVPRTPVSVSVTTTLRAAAAALADEGIWLARVHDGPVVVGIVSERDLVAALATQADLDVAQVGEVMLEDVLSVERDASILEVAWAMVDAEVRTCRSWTTTATPSGWYRSRTCFACWPCTRSDRQPGGYDERVLVR